jgi:hypothetical protein
MFNCRVLETHLQKTFHHDNRRLWQKIGAGSYYLSEEAIQVRPPPPPPLLLFANLRCVTGPTEIFKNQQGVCGARADERLDISSLRVLVQIATSLHHLRSNVTAIVSGREPHCSWKTRQLELQHLSRMITL